MEFILHNSLYLFTFMGITVCQHLLPDGFDSNGKATSIFNIYI